jgi:hypothetical protein
MKYGEILDLLISYYLPNHDCVSWGCLLFNEQGSTNIPANLSLAS